jgi:hypothetical protein
VLIAENSLGYTFGGYVSCFVASDLRSFAEWVDPIFLRILHSLNNLFLSNWCFKMDVSAGTRPSRGRPSTAGAWRPAWPTAGALGATPAASTAWPLGTSSMDWSRGRRNVLTRLGRMPTTSSSCRTSGPGHVGRELRAPHRAD